VVHKKRPATAREKGVTIGLLVIWLMLISFAAISALNPVWYQKLAAPGVDVEARTAKNHGDAFLQGGDYERAIVNYLKALDIQPENVGAQVNMAIACGKMGDTQGGIRILKSVLREDPGQFGTVAFNLAELLVDEGKTREAIHYYERALEDRAQQGLVYAKLGVLYFEMREFKKARSAFQSALEAQRDPRSSYRDMLIRELAVHEGNPIYQPFLEEQCSIDLTEEDLELYDLEIIRDLQRNDPEIARTHCYLGVTHARLGTLPDAAHHLEISLEIWPQNPNADNYREMLRELREALADGDAE
jgi:tetratricopeptide (TPR) repeat protein